MLRWDALTMFPAVPARFLTLPEKYIKNQARQIIVIMTCNNDVQ